MSKGGAVQRNIGYRKTGTLELGFLTAGSRSGRKFEFDCDSNFNQCQIQIPHHCGSQLSKPEVLRFCVPIISQLWPSCVINSIFPGSE